MLFLSCSEIHKPFHSCIFVSYYSRLVFHARAGLSSRKRHPRHRYRHSHMGTEAVICIPVVDYSEQDKQHVNALYGRPSSHAYEPRVLGYNMDFSIYKLSSFIASPSAQEVTSFNRCLACVQSDKPWDIRRHFKK